MHHPWYRLKIRLREAVSAIGAPLHIALQDDLSGTVNLTALVRPDADAKLNAPAPDWQKPTTVTAPCEALATEFSIRPVLAATTPRGLTRTERQLLALTLSEAAAAAVKESRILVANETRVRLEEDIRRATLLARVFDRVRVTLGFSQFYVLRALPAADSAEILFHSDKADLTLDKSQVVKLTGPLHVALTKQQPASGALTPQRAATDGLPFIAYPIAAPSAGAVAVQAEDNGAALLVLAGPVPFPGDTGSRTRRMSFLDYAMIKELAGIVRPILGDYHMQRDLSHNYEMAFHNTGRAVDSIAGALSYLMEMLYGFDPDTDTERPPVMALSPLTDTANPKRVEDLVRANYANALWLSSQIHRFELSKPRMYRYAIEVIDKPIKDCLAPILRTLPHYDVVHKANKATQVNHLTNVAEFPEPILADPRALQIVFSNLIDNAIKYRKRGGPAQIDISWINADNHVRFVFRDQGLGLRQGEEEAIFHPYVRGTAAKQYAIPGTGLGLATVRELLRGMDGKITAERHANGTAFVVRLPRAGKALGGQRA